MPILGEGIRVARVVSILKQAGAAVQADDALCEVETDKAVFPIECDEDELLEEWLVAVDDEVAVGQDLARLKVDATHRCPGSGCAGPGCVPAVCRPVQGGNSTAPRHCAGHDRDDLPLGGGT